MMAKLYNWTLRLAGHRRAGTALAGVSFAESTVFPIPPDVLLIPMVLARRDRAWRYAALCTLTSVAGGLLGYGIGFLFFETVARPLLDFYHYSSEFQNFQDLYTQYGAWIVAVGGFTPIPFKVVTIASGVVDLNLAVFCLAALASRGARFFLVAGLVWKFGPPVQVFLEKRLGWVTVLFLIILIGGFMAIGRLMGA